MYALTQARQEAVTALKKAIGKGFVVTTEDLETPPNTDMGDIAFPCFVLAKEQGRNPAEIATEIAAKVGPAELIESANAAGPYVNFKLKKDALTKHVLEAVAEKGATYGHSDFGRGKKVLIEYAQPNTHKAFHVGHVRNATLGQSIANVQASLGYTVTTAAYIGDIGAHVAKAIWGYKKFQGDRDVPKEDRIAVLKDIYERATAEVEAHPEDKEEVDAIQRGLEAGDAELTKLWKETRQWSIDEFKKIFSELNVNPDVWYYESQVEQPGKELVNQLLTEGIAKKSEGATIVDLEEERLGAFLILKSDGSSLYATKDLALALKKEEDYAPDRQLFVVDARQSLYFKQLFATLKRMGFKKQLAHIAYDFVTLPDGAMSSRKGNVVLYRELHAQMVDVLSKETAKRHEDWNEKQVAETADAIARAAMTFFMLRQDPQSIITFDTEEALSFEGFTGPYVLYTIARSYRVQAKTKVKAAIKPGKLTHELETGLIRKMMTFTDVIETAGTEYRPSVIAQYAFDLAKLFNEYYHAQQIIVEADTEGSAARLALVNSVRQVLENALALLAIDPVKEM